MLSYVLAAGGLLLAAVSMAMLMKRNLNHRAANAMFVKLATAGNVERMRKLCRAAGGRGTYFDAIDAAVAAGLVARTREPEALETAVDAAYDKAGLEVASRWKSYAERGLLGVIVVGAGLGLAVSDDRWPTPLLALSAAGAAVGLYLVTKRGAMVEALIGGRETVLPPLVAALRGELSAAAGEPAPRIAEAAPEDAAPTPDDPAPAPDVPLAAGSLRVRIRRGDTLVRSQTLDTEVIKIGRLKTAHLQLDDDDISRLHAVIERGADGVVVIDLGSASGTLVNGQKVNKKTLRSGDVIGIGPFQLEIELES